MNNFDDDTQALPLPPPLPAFPDEAVTDDELRQIRDSVLGGHSVGPLRKEISELQGAFMGVLIEIRTERDLFRDEARADRSAFLAEARLDRKAFREEASSDRVELKAAIGHLQSSFDRASSQSNIRVIVGAALLLLVGVVTALNWNHVEDLERRVVSVEERAR